MVELTNNIKNYFRQVLLERGKGNFQDKGGSKSDHKEESNSNSNEVFLRVLLTEFKKNMFNFFHFAVSYARQSVIIKKPYMLYAANKIPDVADNFLIVFFIVFIVCIKHRKMLSDAFNFNFNTGSDVEKTITSV
jgi:hypothetical protein